MYTYLTNSRPPIWIAYFRVCSMNDFGEDSLCQKICVSGSVVCAASDVLTGSRVPQQMAEKGTSRASCAPTPVQSALIFSTARD